MPSFLLWTFILGRTEYLLAFCMSILFWCILQSLSINEFLKPSVGERYYTPGGRGRGRGPRGGGRFNQGGSQSSYAPEAPKIEDPSHFPTLGGK